MPSNGEYEEIDFVPPKDVSEEARKGLDLRRAHGRGGTSVGFARARDLKNQRRSSPKTIRRMVQYFARHDVDRNADGFDNDANPSAGYIAWLLWGGDSGRTWCEDLARRMDRANGRNK